MWAMRGRLKTKEEREDGAGEMPEKSGYRAQLGKQGRNQIKRCERMVSYLGTRRQLFPEKHLCRKVKTDKHRV